MAKMGSRLSLLHYGPSDIESQLHQDRDTRATRPRSPDVARKRGFCILAHRTIAPAGENVKWLKIG